MAQKIQIDAGHNQSISALHQVPAEKLTQKLDETLIIMSHGFPGNLHHHENLYGDIEFLVAGKGYHSLRFDYRGCGESDGQQHDFTLASACADFQSVLQWARTQGYTRFFLIGDGLGASLALMNMDIDVKGLVLFWAALDLDAYCKIGLGIDSLSESELARGYVDKNGHYVSIDLLRELNKTNLHQALKEIFVPSIFLHGAQDDMVPVKQLDLARRYIPARRVEITIFEDGKHGLPQQNHRKAMMFQFQQFIDKYI